MNAVAAWPALMLLMLAVLGARPATRHAARLMLLLQSATLCLCLLAHGLADGTSPLPFVCGLAVLAEIVVLTVRTGGRPVERSPPTVSWPMLAAVLCVWLSFRLLPPPMPVVAEAALATVLCGMVGLLAAPRGPTAAIGLLTAGHGVLLFVGAVPGPGWPGLLMAVLTQGVVLALFCARPAWADEVGTEPG